MDVKLKIWRASPSGERALVDYEVEAPEWATLLDVLDIIKDRHDGTLAYRKSCRMMICGSCGMRMDGAAVLACKTRMGEIVESGHVPVISAMGNLPIVKDLVVDMEPFWAKFRSVNPYLQPGLHRAAGRARAPHLAGADERDPQGVALHQLRLLRLGVQRDGVEPRVPRPAGAREGDAVRRRSARRREERAARGRQRRSTGSGSARAATSATSAARRASTRAMRSRSSAPSRSRRGSTATWAPSTRSGSSPRRRRPAGCARPSSCRRRRASSSRSSRSASRSGSPSVGKVPLPFPPHVAKDVRESRRLHDLLYEQDRRGYAGIVQGEAALAKLAHGHHEGERDPYGAGLVPAALRRREEASVKQRRLLQGLPRLAVGEGARLLDAGARAEGRARPDRARDGHLLRRRATSRRPSPTTTCT